MKIKSSQTATAVMLCVGAFFLVAFLRQTEKSVDGAIESQAVKTEDAFIEEVRTLQEQTPDDPNLMAALPSVEAPQDEVPVIELESQELDMGVISADEVARKSFKVYNRGKAVLNLLDITTTCHCTLGAIPEASKSIPPGGEGVIDVIVNPARIPGFQSHKTLTVFSSDPKNNRVSFAVKAKITPEFTLEPETLDLGNVQKGDTTKHTIRIRQNTNLEFELKEITARRPSDKLMPANDFTLGLKMLPKEEWKSPDMKEYEASFALNENVPLGAYLRYFYMTTTLRRLPFYAYRVEGVISSFYTLDPAIPNALTLMRPAGSQVRVTQTATLQSEIPLEISNLVFDENFLEVTVRNGDAPGIVHLDVSLKAVQAGQLDKRVDFTVKGGDTSVPESVNVKIFGDGPAKRGL